MAAPTTTHSVTVRKLSSTITSLWAKIKSTFQTLGNLVTAWGSTPSDTKYPSEKLVKTSLDTIPFNADFQFMTQGGTSDKCCIVKFSKPVNAYNGSNYTTVGLYVLDAYNYRSSAGPEYQSKVQLMIKITDGASTNSSVVAIDGLSGKYLPLSGFSLHVKTAVNDVVDIYLVYTTNNNYVTCVGKFSRLWDVNYFTETWYKSSTSFTPFDASGDSVSKSVITDNILTKLTGFVGGTLSFTDGKPVIDTSALGTLDVAHGGTGKTSFTAGNYLVGNGTSAMQEHAPKTVGNKALAALDADTDNVYDTDYIIGSNHTAGATDTATFVRRTADKLWNYIKNQISSVLGLTATAYGGNAETATTATTAAGYTSGGAIDTALQGKVDTATDKGLSTNDFTDAYKSSVDSNTSARHTHSNKSVLDGISDTDVANWNAAEPNVQSDWNQATTTADDYIKNKPDVPRYFNKYSGSTSVYGWKIGSTVTDNSNGKSSVMTGVFTLALGINVENAPQESTTVKTKATMVGFFSCYARYENSANVVKARVYTPVSSISDSTFNLKYIDEGNGKFTWVLGFGTGTAPASKDYVYCSVNVLSSFNADFGNFGDAITSAPAYGDYFSVFKSPAIGQNTSGIGTETKPAYVDTNGFMKTCGGTVSRAACYSTSPQGIGSDALESYDTFVLPTGANPSVNVSDLVIDKPYKFYVNGSYSGSHPLKMSFAKGTLSSYTVYTGGSSSTKTGTYNFSQETKSQPLLVVHSVSGTTHNLFIIGY